MRIRILFGALLFILLSTASIAQEGLGFGIRAGLNYSKLRGPVETGVIEKYGFDGGFHFGLDFRYNFSKFFSVQSELLYIQNGTRYDFEGVGYYIFPSGMNRPVVVDSSFIDLTISNAYLSFPFTAHIRTLEKWEFYGGIQFNFLLSPVGNGRWIFGEITADHAFDQRLDHRYNGDDPGEFNVFSDFIRLIVNGENVDLPRIVGAYYFYQEKNGGKFNGVDIGLTGGMAYYLNPGLYLGLRLDYGLKDVTNNRMDISLKELNPDGSFILRDDKDTHLGFQISLGFKF